MTNSPIDYCPADSAADDLSDFELREIAEDVIRELREEGQLRPTPVNPAATLCFRFALPARIWFKLLSA